MPRAGRRTFCARGPGGGSRKGPTARPEATGARLDQPRPQRRAALGAWRPASGPLCRERGQSQSPPCGRGVGVRQDVLHAFPQLYHCRVLPPGAHGEARLSGRKRQRAVVLYAPGNRCVRRACFASIAGKLTFCSNAPADPLRLDGGGQTPNISCREVRQLKNSKSYDSSPLEQWRIPAQAGIRHHSSSNQKLGPFLRRSHHEPNETSIAPGAHRAL